MLFATSYCYISFQFSKTNGSMSSVKLSVNLPHEYSAKNQSIVFTKICFHELRNTFFKQDILLHLQQIIQVLSFCVCGLFLIVLSPFLEYQVGNQIFAVWLFFK